MKISNEKQVVWQRFRLFLITILVAFIICVFLFTVVGDEPTFGINKGTIIIGLIALYLLVLLFFFSLDMNYIFFKDDGQKIIFRYYSQRPFSSIKGSIEIKKSMLKKVEFTNRFLGLKKYVIFYQQTNQGLAKYHPVSITALNREQIRALKNALSDYSAV